MSTITQEEIILKLIDKIDKGKYKNSKLLRYFNGDHDIYREPVKDPTKSNQKASFNYPKKMSENSTGYILGKPVTYNSKSGNKGFTDAINFYYSSWEKEHNINIKLQSAIFGNVFEVSYINTNAEFQCTYFTPLEMAVLYDGSVDNKVSLAVRRYKLEFSEETYYEVWDSVNYYRYKGSVIKANLIESKPHRFSRCPVRELKNNSNSTSEYADIIPIVDMYNSLYSNSVSEVSDFRNAYLKIQGADLTEEESQKMKSNGILLLPNVQSDANWMTKDVNSQFFKDLLEGLRNEIYVQSSQIDLNLQPQSNTSMVSTRLRLQELENRVSISESIFERMLLDRLGIFCEWLKIAKSQQYDYRDISITFSRNVPVDLPSIVQMIVSLQGILPNTELLSWLPNVNNPQALIDKLKEEQDTMNLDNIGG